MGIRIERKWHSVSRLYYSRYVVRVQPRDRFSFIIFIVVITRYYCFRRNSPSSSRKRCHFKHASITGASNSRHQSFLTSSLFIFIFIFFSRRRRDAKGRRNIRTLPVPVAHSYPQQSPGRCASVTTGRIRRGERIFHPHGRLAESCAFYLVHLFCPTYYAHTVVQFFIYIYIFFFGLLPFTFAYA